MAKLTTSDLTTLTNETSAVATMNANNALIETAMENTLSRDGTTPNTMSADIDLNGNDLLNIGTLVLQGGDTLNSFVDTANTAATNAENSATASESSANAAASSATAAAASYDSFDDRYLGAKSSDPSTDNDGASLITGALYFNSSTNLMMVYSGSSWGSTIPTGTLSGPSSSTDSAFALFDGTGGNLLKNSSLTSASFVAKTATTGSAGIPVGTTAERDGSPATGYFRYNSTETQFEGYDGSAWGQIGGGAGYFKGDNGTVGSSPGDIFRINEAELNANVTIAATENASATGPVSVASGVTLTVDGVLVII